MRIMKLKKEDEFFSNLAIIGMELIEKDEKAVTLYGIVKEYNSSKNKDEIREQYELYVNMGRFIVLNLLLNTDFTHGDFHASNIMINKNDNTYFKNFKGSPVIIDFGFADKIKDEELLSEIDELFERKKYIQILRLLCDIPRIDGANLKVNNEKAIGNYGWICGNFDLLEEKNISPDDEYWNKANKQIDELFESRNEKINELRKEFKIKHENEPDKYPLLPISENMYNNFFKGIYSSNKRRYDE